MRHFGSRRKRTRPAAERQIPRQLKRGLPNSRLPRGKALRQPKADSGKSCESGRLRWWRTGFRVARRTVVYRSAEGAIVRGHRTSKRRRADSLSEQESVHNGQNLAICDHRVRLATPTWSPNYSQHSGGVLRESNGTAIAPSVARNRSSSPRLMENVERGVAGSRFIGIGSRQPRVLDALD